MKTARMLIGLAALLVLTGAASRCLAQETPAVPAPDSTALTAPAELPPAPAPVATPPAVSTPAPVTPAPTGIANSPTPTRPHLALPRPEATVRAERDQMQSLANTADVDILEAKRKLIEAKGTVQIKKGEIELLNSRIKAAKQAKATSDQKTIEAEKKRQDAMKDYFERMADVAEATIAEAEARRELTKAAVRACDLELQLVNRAGVAAFDSDANLFKLEQQFLEAMRVRGSAQEKMSNRQQDLASKKLKVYSAWANYLSGK